MSRKPILVLGLLLTSTALARPIKLSSMAASATSSYPETEGVNYDPKNLVDSKVSNVWVEGEPGSGLGSSVTLDLGADQSVSGFRIWNGNWYSADFWKRHNRVKDIEVTFADGSKQSFTLKDEMTPETVTFPKAVTTSSLKLTIKSIYGGSTFPDTCISEIQVLDTQPEDYIRPVGGAASTTYPADADSNYDPKNMWDAMLDTMWCENAPGDGTNEWVEEDLGSPKTINKLTIDNGNAYSLSYNVKSNRALKATLKFDDGATEELTLKPVPTPQVLTFSPHTTQKVRITFTQVQKGTDPEDPSANDLCISEARFSG